MATTFPLEFHKEKRLSVAAGRIVAAAARRFGSTYRPHNHSCGAANAGLHRNSIGSTIVFTGAALHTRVKIYNHGFSVLNNENSVRTNLRTQAAACAFVSVQLQGHNVFEVLQFCHNRLFAFLTQDDRPTISQDPPPRKTVARVLLFASHV